MKPVVSYAPSGGRWDVVVAGGGPAGAAAAIAAARQGVRVLLIERACSLGGMGTSALVPSWCPFSDKKRLIYGGLAVEIFKKAKEGVPHVPGEQLDWVPIDAEHLKRVYEALAQEAGVTLLFDTFLVAAQRDGGNVTRVIVANKAGLSAVEAGVFIDATGDADLVAFAGGSFVQGDSHGGVQPATLCFTLANVDEAAYRRLPWGLNPVPGSPEVAEQIMKSGRYPEIPDGHLFHTFLGGGCIGFNAGHLYDVDSTDSFAVSRAMVQGRRLAAAYRDALREFVPEAFGRAHLVQTGSLLGTRESRRVTGLYTLTVDDYVSRRTFPDEICRNAYFIDIHLSRAEVESSPDWTAAVHGRFRQYDPGESHGIPYRCLVPESLRNVLVAGRCISTDRIVQGSVRVMPVCLAMGEAAGTAAALAFRTHHGDTHRVDPGELRRILRAQGGHLPEIAAETPGPGLFELQVG